MTPGRVMVCMKSFIRSPGGLSQAVALLRGHRLAVVVGEVCRWLVERQTRYARSMFGDVGKRDRAADRVAVQVEPLKTSFRRKPVEPVDLHLQRVVVGHLSARVDLKLLDLAIRRPDGSQQWSESIRPGVRIPGTKITTVMPSSWSTNGRTLGELGPTKSA